jgi:hypothetical protein
MSEPPAETTEGRIVVRLAAKIDESKIRDALGALVHDARANEAAAINIAGLESQIDDLRAGGETDESLVAALTGPAS